jgi:microcompartment protein CcmL/EutN
MTAVIVASDTMVKASDVSIIELRLGKGLAGKSYVIVTGNVQNVRTAIDAALDSVQDRGVLISAVVIPSINPDLIKHLV